MNCSSNKAFAVCLAIVFCASSAFALTPAERKIVLRAKQHLLDVRRQLEEATKESLLSDQRASEAQKHANETDALAATLRKEIDVAHNNEAKLAAENNKMRPVYEKVNGPWWAPGLGGIIYGFKRLAVHMLILAAVIVVIFVLIGIFVPAAGPIFRVVTGFFGGLLRSLGRALTGVLNRFRIKALP